MCGRVTINAMYKINLVASRIFRGKELSFTHDELCTLKEEVLPIYTVLSPIYREPETLLRLKEPLDGMQYPREQLDIKLLLEEADRETIKAVKSVEWGLV